MNLDPTCSSIFTLFSELKEKEVIAGIKPDGSWNVVCKYRDIFSICDNVLYIEEENKLRVVSLASYSYLLPAKEPEEAGGTSGVRLLIRAGFALIIICFSLTFFLPDYVFLFAGIAAVSLISALFLTKSAERSRNTLIPVDRAKKPWTTPVVSSEPSDVGAKKDPEA